MLFTVTTSPDANARMDVLANGQVLPGNSVSDVWVSLDGITFASTSIPTATT
jgi:archaellum component FlaF (FlaF/FlaG flagellin family)